MAATIGSIQEFDPDIEAITAYLERVQLFMTANAVKDDKKVAVLLSIIGSKAYGLRNLLEPARPSEKSYNDLVAVLKEDYEPKPIVITERFVSTDGCKHQESPSCLTSPSRRVTLGTVLSKGTSRKH